MKVNGQWIPCVRSFIPILLKPYRCSVHALKMCMWFGYGAQIYFYHVFFATYSFFGHFHNESEWTVDTLCAQLLLQFYSHSFET